MGVILVCVWYLLVSVVVSCGGCCSWCWSIFISFSMFVDLRVWSLCGFEDKVLLCCRCWFSGWSWCFLWMFCWLYWYFVCSCVVLLLVCRVCWWCRWGVGRGIFWVWGRCWCCWGVVCFDWSWVCVFWLY